MIRGYRQFFSLQSGGGLDFETSNQDVVADPGGARVGEATCYLGPLSFDAP